MERDLRIDFFRGLALFCIFIDHLPNNILASFTFQSVMFSDAAEVFVLISGYTAGMVYGRVVQQKGFLTSSSRIYHRIFQLYLAHVFLFVAYTGIVVYTASALNSGLYAEEFGAASFLNQPMVALAHALALQFQPAFMDILPLYIVLLSLLPLVLAGFRYSAWPVFTVSLAVWLLVQFDSRIALPTYPGPDGVWFFNPLAWQALFILGAWLGWRKIQGGVPLLTNRLLFWSAVGVSVAGLLVRFSWTLDALYGGIPVPISANLLWPFLDKGNLGAFRFINVLAVALVSFRLIGPRALIFAKPVAWPFLVCGRNSLYVFCLGILLSLFVHLRLSEFLGSTMMQVASSGAGIGIMIGAAALIESFSTRYEIVSSAIGLVKMARGARR